MKLKKDKTVIPSTKYVFKKEYPLERISSFKEHKRMKVFYHKGFKCATCKEYGTRLILGVDKTGRQHIDVYTENLKLMTVDHIFPKALGGNNDMENLQPMCLACNSKKGSRVIDNTVIKTEGTK